MPVVVDSGKSAPTTPPPAGIVARCTKCGATLKTAASEPQAQATVFEDRGIKMDTGWNIPCPCCGNIVFFSATGRPQPNL